MTWSAHPGAYGAADPLFLLLAALALEAYLGGPWIAERRYLQPRRPVNNLIVALERRLNRSDRGGLDLLLRGAVVAVFLSLAALLSGWLVEWILLNYPFAWVFEVLFLALILGQRTACQQASAVSSALADGSAIRAQEALRPLVIARVPEAMLGRLEGRGIVAAALDGVARAFVFQVIAPVFWFVLLGLPGVFWQQTIRVAAGYLSARQLQHQSVGSDALEPKAGLGRGDFASTLLRLDTALSVLPMLCGALLLLLAAAFIPGCSPRLGLRRAWSQGGSVSAVMGGLLGLDAAMDSGSAMPAMDRSQIERAVAVFAVGCLLNAGLVAALAWVRVLAA